MRKRLLEVTLLRRKSPGARTSPAEIFFATCGVGAEDVALMETRGSIGASVYVDSWKKAARLHRAFEAAAPRGWKWRERVLGPADWFTKWQTAYRISPFGSKFTVVPYWQKKRFHGKRIPILIDPKGQFGSGTHETTRIVARLMERLEGRFRTFLDAGTGTGILMVAAARLGCPRIAGIDTDPDALAAARANLAHNKVKGSLRRLDAAREKGKYDLVAANLISKDLLQSQGALGRAVRKGGHLAVSGIEKRNFEAFLESFRPPGMRCVETVSGRGWCGALYARR